MKIVGIIISSAIIIFVAYIYNSLVKARNNVREAYSKMDINLKNRWDLIPNLVQVVKNYSVFEEQTLEKLTKIRNQDFTKFQMEQKLNVDENISKVINKMFGIIENYPDLKADEGYIFLNQQLVKLEDNIANSRKEYNDFVKEYNTKIEVVPNNLIAILFGFNEEKFYKALPEEKKDIKVDL